MRARNDVRTRLSHVLVAIAFLAAFGALGLGAAHAADRQRLTIEGRIECVGPTGKKVACNADSQRFALRTDDGTLYRFSPEDPLANLFKDARVRQRRFQIKVWTRDDAYVDIVKIYSIKQGRLYDIYFYCPVCSIRSYEAGDCWCCHQPYELREVPVDE